MTLRPRIYFILLMLVSTIFAMPLWAAYLTNMPTTLTQPDGTTLQCFASGDEYHNWLHDKDHYTIIQSPITGYYVYAVRSGSDIVAGDLIVGQGNPASRGITPNINISEAQYKDYRHTKFPMSADRDAPTTGNINNLVVYIRFSGETEFGQTVTTYDGWFNSDTSSLTNYFAEASYNQLHVNTTFYPAASGGYVVSWQDSHTRGFFEPYNSVTNAIGYQNDSQRTIREFELLEAAIAGIATDVPTDLNIDADNDGNVDNVVFIIRGTAGGWAELLWPHRWAIEDLVVTLNGKRVYDFNLQLQNFLTSSSVGVLCHEFFHTLGAPDLYHYTSNGIAPAGAWDLMENNANPPQHMGAFMKWKYGHWIASIPTITANQIYTLNPLTSPTGNAYRINSPNSATEYYIVEYRKKTGTFENSIPGSGLLVYRINTTVGDGNADGPPDEVYIYRPGGTTTVSGTINSAYFSSEAGRTAINGTTNPNPFLTSGAAGGLNLYDIGSSADATMSFNKAASDITTVPNPAITPSPAHTATNIAINTNLAWASGGANPTGYRLSLGTNYPPTNILSNGYLGNVTTYDPTANLQYGTTYYWKVTPYNSLGNALDCPVWRFSTMADPTIISYPYTQNFDAVAVPDLPMGWAMLNANNDSYAWGTTASNASSAPNAASVGKSTAVAMDDWLITPPISMMAHASYRISFFYRAGDATRPEKLALMMGASATPAGMTQELFSNTNIVNTAYVSFQYTYDSTVAQTVFLGFHGFSAANMDSLYVDDFSITEIAEAWNPPANLSASVTGNNVTLNWTSPVGAVQRALTGFKVYRDDVLISTLNDPLTMSYTDLNLWNHTYWYSVKAVYTYGESPAATIIVAVHPNDVGIAFSDDFESYDNFVLAFAPWVLIDQDHGLTFGIPDVSFPNSGTPMAFIIFNPSATTPPITDINAHSGTKMAAAFAATAPPNRDWLITPRIHLGFGSAISFYAKSQSAQNGLERFRVGVSTNTSTIPAGFQYISGTTYVEAPLEWTEFWYNLSAFDGQEVWIGIVCVSDEASIFYVDDVSIYSAEAIVIANDDNSLPAVVTSLHQNFPNPFNPETTISFSLKEASPVTLEIYNVKGQLVKTLVSEAKAAGNHSVVWNGKDNTGHTVPSGVYFSKLKAGNYIAARKLILMK